MARICTIGTGYVGLITGATFAEMGHEVVCVDIDENKVGMINAGKPPIYEKGLDELLENLVSNGKLRATTSTEEAVSWADASFICVGTPSRKDGSIDLSYVKAAAIDIARGIKKAGNYHIVVTKSTVVPGTGEEVVIPAIEGEGLVQGEDFGYASNPEFLKEGTALEDSRNPDRIVVGSSDGRVKEFMEKLYAPYSCPKVFTDITTAEMIKYAANSFLATKISFANEMARLCMKLGIDVYEVMDGIGLDRRINREFLNAGLGFGGSCFPKDVSAIRARGREVGVEMPVLDAVLEVNRTQPLIAVDMLKDELGELEGKKIAVLGAAFKPDTDDVRESRAIPLVRELHRLGADVWVWDPLALENFRNVAGEIAHYTTEIRDAMDGAEAVVIQTAWDEVRTLTPEFVKGTVRRPFIIDGRRALDKRRFEESGVTVKGIGW